MRSTLLIGRSHIHLFTLYFLDSNDYQKKKYIWSKLEYDYIKAYEDSFDHPLSRY